MVGRWQSGAVSLGWALFVLARPGAVWASAASQPTWTIQAIVEAPRVTDSIVSRSGRYGVYIVRRCQLAQDRCWAELVQVDLQHRHAIKRLSARWISHLEAEPRAERWSFLADLGGAVQLYEMDTRGHIRRLAAGTGVAVIGTDRATALGQTARDPDERYGVLDYGWSPTQQAFWYTTAHAVPLQKSTYRSLTAPTTQVSPFRPSVSELHVVDTHGHDRRLARARSPDDLAPVVVYAQQAARWDADGDHLTFHRTVKGQEVCMIWSLAPATPSSCDHIRAPTLADYLNNTDKIYWGPNGGRLQLQGDFAERQLVEIQEGKIRLRFGAVDVMFTHDGLWRFPKAKTVVASVKHFGLNSREGLMELSADGRMRDLDPANGLTNCALSPVTGLGLCVRQAINVSPQIVIVDVAHWSVQTLGALDPVTATIPPLTVIPKVWTRGEGAARRSASGFIVLPRHFVPGQRYPMILLTHGFDAVNAFADEALQWSYPAQVWSERGYVVVYLNDIPVTTNAVTEQAYLDWATRSGTTERQALFKAIWLDNVAMYATVVRDLDASGVIDPARVGVAGYSRGSQMVDIAITQGTLFAAASSGDGGIFSPGAALVSGQADMDARLFGGGPYDPHAAAAWQQMSPALRADKASAAVLFQMVDDGAGAGKVEFYAALRAVGKPAAYNLFTRETHLLHDPANRAAAMQQNLDWFDFWLKGREDPDPRKVETYRAWRAMREGCVAKVSP